MATHQDTKSEVATFEEILALIQQQDRAPLIDVRDVNEVELGVIPTAHHIPLGELRGALTSFPSLSDQEVSEKFGLKKFGKDNEVIFYCRSGRRSKLAFELAQELGYTGVRHYPGSWNEWSVKYHPEK
ncbi:MAG: Rhodanese-like domain-containing protein [Benniella sp.]|nr:MAG: Rhodanese-like domain-containing protein [Benniella sp.]